MMTTTAADAVRRDVWSVKEKEGDGPWVHVSMFYSARAAKRHARHLCPILGFTHAVKIVHPRQWVVDGFTAYGNSIQD